MKKPFTVLLMLVLLWTLSCKDDDPCTAPVVTAGEDQELIGETTAALTSTSSINEGTWTITSGDGGVINQVANPATLTGEPGNAYTLKFEATSPCGSSFDEVVITFRRACANNLSVEQQAERIHWIQQACFRIETTEFTIYTDPNSVTQKDTADVVLITHSHGDHNSATDIEKLIGPKTILIAPQDVIYSGTLGRRVTLKPGESFTAFDCINVTAVPAYNVVKTNFHPKANNWVGYLITVDGVTIYHAGDTERIPEMKSFTCDIAMLPLGQTYTFDSVTDAVEAAKDVKAKLAIPMHFGYAEGTSEDALSFKSQLEGIIPVVIKEKGN